MPASRRASSFEKACDAFETAVAKHRLNRKLVAASLFLRAGASKQPIGASKQEAAVDARRSGLQTRARGGQPRVNFSGRPARPVAFFVPSEARHQQAFAASIRIVIPTPQMSSFVHSHSL
jgi:hypothetical protein